MKNNGSGKFSIDGFKQWISENGGLESVEPFKFQEPKDKHIGQFVEAKTSTKKIAARMEAVEGEAKDLIMDFANDGGTILEVEDDKFLIEVDSGKFYLPRHCVKKTGS